jgi:hypothetical protein
VADRGDGKFIAPERRDVGDEVLRAGRLADLRPARRKAQQATVADAALDFDGIARIDGTNPDDEPQAAALGPAQRRVVRPVPQSDPITCELHCSLSPKPAKEPTLRLRWKRCKAAQR